MISSYCYFLFMHSAKCYWEGRDVFMKIFETLFQFLSVPKFKILGELFTVTLNHHQMQLKSVFKFMILFILKNKKKTCIKVQNWSACRMEVEKFKDLACLHFNARVIIALRRIKKMYSSSCQQRDCFQTTCLIDMSVYIRDIKSGA